MEEGEAGWLEGTGGEGVSDKKDKGYDPTVARIAGNLLSGIMADTGGKVPIPAYMVENAVYTAKEIVKLLKDKEK